MADPTPGDGDHADDDSAVPAAPDGTGAHTADAPSTVDDAARRSRRRRAVWVGVGVATVVVVVAVVVITSRPTTTPAAPVAAPPPVTTEPPTTTSTMPPTTETEPPTTVPADTPTTRKPHRVPTGPPGPLTGAPVDLPGYERRPALVLKIDNLDPDARPQAGVNQADIVYEEKVEGPYSRFAAVFQGSDADQIGPIRSARSTDVQIVGPLAHPLFGYSGANGGFLQLLSISPLIDVGAGMRGGAYYRGGDKPVPHNLYTSTGLLYSGASGYVPQPLWSFRGPADAPGAAAQAAASVTYHFGGGMTLVTWNWDPAEKAWIRSQNGSVHYDLDNWPIAASNVVIQYVQYEDSFAQDMFGNNIPEALLGGTGRGWVLTGGAAVPMTWSRYALTDPTVYKGADNAPIRFAPGHTWVILVPVQYPATVRFANGTAAN